MIQKIIAVPSVILECGPGVFGGYADTDHAHKARAYQQQIFSFFGISAQIAMYTRIHGASHCNPQLGPTDGTSDGFPIASVRDVEQFVHRTNQAGLPCLLAYNGVQRDDSQCVIEGLDHKFLRLLDTAGRESGVKNSVIIAEHDLLEQIREQFRHIAVIASCISISTERSIKRFEKDVQISQTDDRFFHQYYQWLLQHYDKVVLPTQLTNRSFLRDFTGNLHKFVFFLEQPCISLDMGRCAAHYRDGHFEALPGFPTIPDHLLSEQEIFFTTPIRQNFPCQNHSLVLLARPLTLQWIIHNCGVPITFKIPERRKDADYVQYVFGKALSLMRSTQVSDVPSRSRLEGLDPLDIAYSLIKRYPEKSWSALGKFQFPNRDGALPSYDESEAEKVRDSLHAAAIAEYSG